MGAARFGAAPFSAVRGLIRIAGCGPGPEELNADRDQRDDDDHGDDRQQVRVDAGNRRAQGVTGQGHPDRPDHAADDLPDREGPDRHVQGAGHRVEHGPDHRDEPGQHDGLAVAVLGQQYPGALRAPAQEAVVGAAEQGTAAPADVIAGLRSEQGAADRGQDDRRQRQVHRMRAGGAQQPGGEQQRIAGQEDTDEQPGLGEQGEEDAERAQTGQQRRRAERVECGHEVRGALGQHSACLLC